MAAARPSPRCVAVIAAALCGGVGALFLHAEPGPLIAVGNFSRESPDNALPAGWRPLFFRKVSKHTVYTLVKDEGTVVVKATAHASASALVREIEVDPREYPIIQWRWKVANIVERSDPTRKAGDDYAARLYVTFRRNRAPALLDRILRALYGSDVPLSGLNYIWESKTPIGTILPNPFTHRVKMIVVESGPSRVNKWVNEERDLRDDYFKAFGEEPPMISGVALMTDTDGTGESATAFYGDIRLGRSRK
jgi:hypothetical protein